jgi:AcrR family transcriptional regulator
VATRKTDKRTLATREALLKAFRELVLTKGYDEVSVGDVAQRAGIGRTTLYLHFTSKQDLLKHSLDSLCSALAECANPDVTPKRLEALLCHFQDQQHINRVFFEEPIRTIWVRRLATLTQKHLRSIKLPRSLAALTIAEMQIGLITHWLKSAGATPPARVAEALVTQTRALIDS